MKIKTSNLLGPALDWAVGIAEDPKAAKTVWRLMHGGNWSPSTRWAEGGPIIEREEISVWLAMDDVFKRDKWAATYPYHEGDIVLEPFVENWGSTPLIAAMRCFVASKLGDEVNIPEELT